MTPQEKAKELIRRYYRDSDLLVEDLSWIQAKECALIAVDEILKAAFYASDEIYTYYLEVKQEIEKL